MDEKEVCTVRINRRHILQYTGETPLLSPFQFHQRNRIQQPIYAKEDSPVCGRDVNENVESKSKSKSMTSQKERREKIEAKNE